MASKSAHKRLTREYQAIVKDPPPYIIAHPSESNILEWHYILTGPPDTPYEGGQYWGTLLFPSDYPFAPPSIRMHTHSGRFSPSERLCLSISDFHPKSYNPAWEVSTILIGVLSFMTGNESTTGSVNATTAERQWHAARSRWWNSTGGGTYKNLPAGVVASAKAGTGNIKAGDGGLKFRTEWPELDEENHQWMKEHKIDLMKGTTTIPAEEVDNTAPGTSTSAQCSPETVALRKRLLIGSAAGARSMDTSSLREGLEDLQTEGGEQKTADLADQRFVPDDDLDKPTFHKPLHLDRHLAERQRLDSNDKIEGKGKGKELEGWSEQAEQSTAAREDPPKPVKAPKMSAEFPGLSSIEVKLLRRQGASDGDIAMLAAGRQKRNGP